MDNDISNTIITHREKILCVIVGESFRSGGRTSHERLSKTSHVLGAESTFNEQKIAIESHIRFLKKIQSKYDIDIDVIVHTVHTNFINDVYKWYRDSLNLINFIVIPTGIGLTESLKECLRVNKLNITKYQSVLCFRIDLFLREFIDTIFNPLGSLITYAWYCTSFDYNTIKVNDQFMCLPKKLFKQINFDENQIKMSHDMKEYYNNVHNIKDRALIYTQHTSDTSMGWNPLFYIVNRIESSIWKPIAIYNRKTIEHIPLDNLNASEIKQFKIDYEHYHNNIIPSYVYEPPKFELLERDKCAITGEENLLNVLYTFNKLPLLNVCIRQPKLKDIFINVSIAISYRYGFIQFTHVLPIDFIYSISPNSSIICDVWGDHHHHFANFIKKFNPKSVLEIGGNNGILSTYFTDVLWYNIDPLGVENPDSNAILIKEFFNENFQPTFEYDTIVHSHTIEHMYNIPKFVKDLSEKLKPEQYVIFSMPNLMEMFKRHFTNSLTLEHTVIIEEDALEYIFNTFNFKLQEKQYFKEAHSIFYCFKRVDYTVECKPLIHRYKTNRDLVRSFFIRNKKICSTLNKKIKDRNNVYIFGAHVSTQFLINFGLCVDDIKGILDNDTDKIGKRLYGTSLYVRTPETLSSAQDAIVILHASNYTEEIKQQLNRINSNITILSYEDVILTV